MSNQPEMPTPDTPQLLLEHHLKALRLPTILREYDKVARQCAEEKADFPRYLLRLPDFKSSPSTRHWLIRTAFIYPATALATSPTSAPCFRSCGRLRRLSQRRCVSRM